MFIVKVYLNFIINNFKCLSIEIYLFLVYNEKALVKKQIYYLFIMNIIQNSVMQQEFNELYPNPYQHLTTFFYKLRRFRKY